MNVGIIAACLPTLKPLASNFYGAVSALTSGERYGSRYGSGHLTNDRTRPYVSDGYMKHNERSGTHSYPMDDMRKPGSPFEPQDFAGGATAYGTSKRRGSSAADSDESILPQQKGIMRTTEVRVS
jgi:hypothetical protein